MTSTIERFTCEQAAAAAAYYHEHGYAVIRKVFDATEIAAAHAATDRLKDGIAAGTLRSRGAFKATRDADSGLARSCWWGALLEPVLDELRRDPRLLALLQPLIGDTLRQLTNNLHWKPPGTSVAVTFHTDRANRKPDEDFRHLETSFVQTGICIDPMHEDNGPLLVVPGSHRVPRDLKQQASGNYGNGDPSRDILTSAGSSAADLVPCLADPGDVVLWHPDTIHGSDSNRSAIDRCLYINGYIDARHTWRGIWAFIKGQPIPAPPIDVPVALGSRADIDRDWRERFA